MLEMINSGDTAWMLMSAALVFLMTPGLAFFYGGLVRKKNILSILMQCMTVICIVTLQWVLFGYSLSFGPDHNGWIGTLAWAGLRGVGAEPCLSYCGTIPHTAYMIYQMMFAIITPALILGAFAERMKFSAFCIFVLLWSTLVYDPVAHWVWGAGGFLRNAGVLDFSGGSVIYLNAGIAALASALVLGKRRDYSSQISAPHNLPLATLGAVMLWFGWFGGNAGSALGANALAANAFSVTLLSAASAGLTRSLLIWILKKHPTFTSMLAGLIAGLVAGAPAAGFVNLWGAIGIGIGASIVSFIAVEILKVKFEYDDSLNAFGIYGMCGLWGVIATGLWATKTVNPNGADGLFYGHPVQLLHQMKAALAIAIYSFGMSWILLKGVDALVGLRVSEASESLGLDLTQHGESGYNITD
jgi:Amt family ammonium transporter